MRLWCEEDAHAWKLLQLLWEEDGGVDAFPLIKPAAATATNGAEAHWSTSPLKTLCLGYVAVIIEININTVSLHGRMLSIFYLSRAWQGEWVVCCVCVLEERKETEASMLRLAGVSEIKPGCCQHSWHSCCGFSQLEPRKGTASFYN